MATKTQTNQPKVYILHGWAPHTDQPAKWQPFIDQLKPKFETQLLSLPGLDQSFAQAAVKLPKQLAQKSWETVDYLEWLRITLPAQPVILIGHSFGGRLSARFAVAYPSRVAKLVLIDTAGLKNLSWSSQIKRALFAQAARVFAALKKITWIRSIVYGLAGEQDYLKAPVELRHTMAEAVRDDLRPILASLTQLTLIIWGQLDQITPLWMGKYLVNNLPNAQLAVIAEARHAPQFSHPVETARIVLNFLKAKAG